MQQPTVVYHNVNIDDKNVQDFISLETPMVYGQFNRNTGVVNIYRYIVNGVSDEFQRTAAILRAGDAMSKEPITIAHETRHWYNLTNFGRPETFAKTYYEFVSLIALDEISAFTAGFLFGDPKMGEINEDKVGKIIIAMHAATSLYLSGLDAYLDKYYKTLKISILGALQSGCISFEQLRAMRATEKAGSKDMYSKNFKSVSVSYMTFDGICVFHDKKIAPHLQTIWAQTRENIQEIKSKCLSVVSKTLDECIDLEYILYGLNQFESDSNQNKK